MPRCVWVTFQWLFAAAVVVGTVFIRVTNIHMTEGELLVAHWRDWLAAGACIAMSAWCGKKAAQ